MFILLSNVFLPSAVPTRSGFFKLPVRAGIFRGTGGRRTICAHRLGLLFMHVLTFVGVRQSMYLRTVAAAAVACLFVRCSSIYKRQTAW